MTTESTDPIEMQVLRHQLKMAHALSSKNLEFRQKRARENERQIKILQEVKVNSIAKTTVPQPVRESQPYLQPATVVDETNQPVSSAKVANFVSSAFSDKQDVILAVHAQMLPLSGLSSASIASTRRTGPTERGENTFSVRCSQGTARSLSSFRESGTQASLETVALPAKQEKTALDKLPQLKSRTEGCCCIIL